MDKVRFGIVGTGGMGSGHVNTIQKIEEAQLMAVCDVEENAVKGHAEKLGIKAFTDYKELVDSGLVDAVIVATPHYFHSVVAVYAMKKAWRCFLKSLWRRQ